MMSEPRKRTRQEFRPSVAPLGLVRMPFRVPCDEGPSGFVSEGDEFVSGVVPTFRESPLRETEALSRILPTKGRPPGRSGEEKQR